MLELLAPPRLLYSGSLSSQRRATDSVAVRTPVVFAEGFPEVETAWLENGRVNCRHRSRSVYLTGGMKLTASRVVLVGSPPASSPHLSSLVELELPGFSSE
jgi:hypothetical protein